jgi:hypothetical protein
MISNYEFIKTQSFEVAWATFRCAELFSQGDLRKKVEAAAVDLIADHDAIGDDGENEFPQIEKLISLVRLAESVGQIASVNANVLYRELDNLARATRLETIERREKKNIASSLENIFTNSAYANNLSSVIPAESETQRKGHPELGSGSYGNSSGDEIPDPFDNAQDKQVRNDKSAEERTGNNSALRQAQDKTTQFGNIESLLSAATQSSVPVNSEVSSAALSNGNTLSQFIPSAGHSELVSGSELDKIDSGSEAGMTRRGDVAMPNLQAPLQAGSALRQAQDRAGSLQAGSWQHVILQKVKDLNQTTTKELTASFPEISERTIRFYLQKLVDNGMIDRVGTTGPGAAYKSRN